MQQGERMASMILGFGTFVMAWCCVFCFILLSVSLGWIGVEFDILVWVWVACCVVVCWDWVVLCCGSLAFAVCVFYEKIHYVQLCDRGFRRNSSLQAVCDSAIAWFWFWFWLHVGLGWVRVVLCVAFALCSGLFTFVVPFFFKKQQKIHHIQPCDRRQDFVETHICKLCVILRSQLLRWCVRVLMKHVGRRLPSVPASIYQGQQGDAKTFIDLRTETTKPVLRGKL